MRKTFYVTQKVELNVSTTQKKDQLKEAEGMLVNYYGVIPVNISLTPPKRQLSSKTKRLKQKHYKHIERKSPRKNCSLCIKEGLWDSQSIKQ